MRRIGGAIVIVVVAAGIAPAAMAQRTSLTPCEFHSDGPTSMSMVGGQEMASGSGGIRVDCRNRNITLIADSGRKIGEDRVELFGNVQYREPTRIQLRSDLLTYFIQEERIHVRGHVVASLPSGSTLTGPEATYLRAVPNVRLIEELTAINNPTVTVAAKGDSGKPVSVNATTIFMRGDSLIYASRNVTITRTDLITHSDSAFLDGRKGTETIRLMFKPSVEGLQGRKFKLEGEVIDAYSKDRKLERVIARGHGHATSQDMDIVADTIDLRMTNDAMERAIAWSYSGRARATSPSQSITADSIDVVMPKQKVRVVHAIRNARAEAAPDTIRFRTTEQDWLRGDVVTAWFDSTTATNDTSSTPPIKRILAVHSRDSAQAYYHLAPADSTTREPAISYVRGREIRLDFDNRKVALVNVRDSVAGIYLEPKRDTAKAVAKPAAPGVPPKPPTASSPVRPPRSAPVGKPEQGGS